ncbi:MAG: hypothetical protein WDW36_009911 [Sanguina aurantia]
MELEVPQLSEPPAQPPPPPPPPPSVPFPRQAVLAGLPDLKVGEVVLGKIVFSNSKGSRVQLMDHPLYIGYCPQDQNPVDVSALPPNRGAAVVEGDAQPGNRAEVTLPLGHVREFKVLKVPNSLSPGGNGPLLSALHHDLSLAWKRLKQAETATALSREAITVTIQGYLNDVLLTRVFGLKAIIPFSQLIPRTDLGVPRWDQPSVHRHLLGTQMKVAIHEVDFHNKALVLSQTVASRWALPPLVPFSLVWGSITKITPWGAFLSMEGYHMDGLLHISQFSRSRVNEMQDAVAVGDRMCCMVLSAEGERVQLATKVFELSPGDMLDRDGWEYMFDHAPDVADRLRAQEEEAQWRRQQSPALASYEGGHNDRRRRDDSGDGQEARGGSGQTRGNGHTGLSIREQQTRM